MKKRTGMLCSLVLTALLLCSGCGRGVQETTAGENVYQIQYINTQQTALVSVPYTATSEGTDTEALIFELVGQMQQTGQSEHWQPSLPKAVQLQRIAIDQNTQTVTLDFNSAYQQMDAKTEILCRAALVKTVIQIPEVARVSITVNRTSLMDGSTVIGAMTADSFVQSTWKDIKTAELVLYFANQNGSKLVQEKRELLYYGTISLERQVLEQLIAGPSEDSGLRATLPSGTKVLSVTTQDGVCFVNLSSEFVDQAYDLNAYLPIYSIVDTLSELKSVTRVQITVNGDNRVMFKDIDLSQEWSRDLTYVENAAK